MASVNDRLESPRQRVFTPFAGVPNWRGSTATKDQRNPITQGAKLYVVKRPGLAAHSQPPAGSATGRGIYYWSGTDKIYTVFANKIYSNTTDLGVTLDASSGRCWFAETPSTFGTGQRLLVSDGTKLYSINTSDSVTTVSTGSDGQFPTSNLGPVLYFDSYIFFAKSNGEIWNSDVDSETSYTSTSFLASEMFADGLEAIIRQKDQIVGFGKTAMEFFFDNANATASPLNRIDQNALQIGLVTKNGLAQAGDLACFVAKHQQDEISVWLIDGLATVKKISTPSVERLLRNEGTSISTCTAFMCRSQGHVFYFLNLDGAERTLVYDTTLDVWTEASDTSGNKFNCVAATEKDGTVYMQDASNGRVYTYSPTTFQDNSSNFTVTLQLIRQNHGTPYIKHCHGVSILGDLTTGNLATSYSDDDYANFSTARNFDLSLQRKFLPRFGQYYDRAWKFTYTDNYALRLEGFDEAFDIGTI
jgi:hypothetical protein